MVIIFNFSGDFEFGICQGTRTGYLFVSTAVPYISKGREYDGARSFHHENGGNGDIPQMNEGIVADIATDVGQGYIFPTYGSEYLSKKSTAKTNQCKCRNKSATQSHTLSTTLTAFLHPFTEQRDHQSIPSHRGQMEQQSFVRPMPCWRWQTLLSLIRWRRCQCCWQFRWGAC